MDCNLLPNDRPENRVEIRECPQESCGFRFPVASVPSGGEHCPLCGAPTRLIVYPKPPSPQTSAAPAQGPALEVLLDNIRSIYNVGAMFRTADGAGIRHLHLCGLTATPEHTKVRKTALGAEQAVPWTYYRNGLEAISRLKARRMQIWALESHPDARSLFEVAQELVSYPTALVMGNEVSGVDPGILTQCDGKVFLPMAGVKESLNVAVAFGAAVYVLRHAYWQSIEQA